MSAMEIVHRRNILGNLDELYAFTLGRTTIEKQIDFKCHYIMEPQISLGTYLLE